MKRTIRAPKMAPRNGHLPAMRIKVSGPHGKTIKAQRRADKISLHKTARDAQARTMHLS